MSYSLNVTIPPNLATSLGDGQSAAAYLASRFGSPPTLNTAVPGGGDDGGGVQTSSGTQVTFSCATYDSYYAACWDPADTTNAGSYNIYWTPALYPDLPTDTHAYAAQTTPVRRCAAASLDSSMDGLTLPQAQIVLDATTTMTVFAGTPSTILIQTDDQGWQLVSYTAVDLVNKKFTGCTGGIGHMAASPPFQVIYAGYRNGLTRRQVRINVRMQTASNGDQVGFVIHSQVGNGWLDERVTYTQKGAQGTDDWRLIPFLVDPSALYYLEPYTGGGASILFNKWAEIN